MALIHAILRSDLLICSLYIIRVHGSPYPKLSTLYLNTEMLQYLLENVNSL